jgi:hypothetical protein
MGELNPNFLSLTMRKLHDLLQAPLAFYMLITPNPAILRRDPSFWDNGCSFYHGEAWTATDYAAQMREVPGCVVAIFGGVLAERGEHDAVLELEAADS